MATLRLGFVFALVFLLAGPLVNDVRAQQKPAKVVQLTGLTGVKNKTKGTLEVQNGKLLFVHSNATTAIEVTSVQDIVTGSDSQRDLRGPVGTMTMFAPYGSGRFLSLFRSPIDTLTIKYRDTDGGLHGAIFTMPVGRAQPLKNALIAQGAPTSIPSPPELATRGSASAQEKKP
jgi:hypothetical protein